MHFNHLGLPVRDERRSLQFYSVYFGFDPAGARQYPAIIRNADGFDLALHPVEHIEPQPVFLHAGFKAAGRFRGSGLRNAAQGVSTRVALFAKLYRFHG